MDVIEKRGLPEFVSFDFDLGATANSVTTGKKNGLDCAIFLLETRMEEHAKLPKWYVHSANKQNGPKLAEFLRVCQKILNT